nr:VIT domain-containing protein [uncultured Capnocytophaga sp.]
MKKFLITMFLLLPFAVMAQKTVMPTVKVVRELNANPMVLQELSVDILVVGQTAVTTMEMIFYNPKSIVMEGEFEFPLADGQQVSRFALDINGKMREGVVVDKALGRKTFETIVRKNVDPGLLEKTEGNNFKARIYPMPAKGTRRVLIAFEQELNERNGEDFYFLPIATDIQLRHFKLRTEVVSRLVKADIQNSLALDFKQARHSYISEVSKENYTLNQNIALTFPKLEKPQSIVATKDKQTYFYGTIALGEITSQSRPQPKEIGLLWDISQSGANRDRAKEFAFLDAYFAAVKDAKVTLSCFNIKTAKPVTFEVKNGQWRALRNALETDLAYDGGTDGNAINFDLKADELLLFTDGIFNFGSKDFLIEEVVKQAKTPVIAVNATAVANTTKMQYIGNSTGGCFVDLTTLTTEQALKTARTVPFQLLNVEVKSGKVANVFPEKGVSIKKSNFTLAGELESEKATLVLTFGYHKQPLVQKEISLLANRDATESTFELLRRVWAEKQIEQLQRLGAEQKQIDAVGREYGIVTEGNSLIVLETLEDYLRCHITPPKELLEAYNEEESEESEEKEITVEEILEEVVELSERQTEWWKTEYPLKKKPKSPVVIRGAAQINDGVVTEENVSEEVVEERINNEAKNIQLEESYDTSANEKALQGEIKYLSASVQAIEVIEVTGGIVLNDFNPDTPYLKVMEYADKGKEIETYYRLKKEYENTPSFYVDVADFFAKKGNKEQAILVISNLAELGLEAPELLRVLGYKLSSYGAKKEAVQAFRKVVKLREEEPQSFRDLGLALAGDAQYNEAVKTLYKVVTSVWDERFKDIRLITMNEINNLIARYKDIDVSYIDKRLVKKEPVDMRVVLSWDSDNCDMDLWVTDPKGDICNFEHELTNLGGKISEDIIEGYGPEEFMLKKAIKGKYKVEVNYYNITSQKQLMPVNLRITFYTHYGTPKQKQQETTVRLSDIQEVIEVGSFEF